MFDYKIRKAGDAEVSPFPAWLTDLFPAEFDQATLNEYLPGQGIGTHVDTHSAFGPEIIVLNLGSGIAFHIGDEVIWLEPRSLLSFSGRARYGVKHAIKERKRDLVDGRLAGRGRRISVTLRKVLEGGKCEWCDEHVEDRKLCDL